MQRQAHLPLLMQLARLIAFDESLGGVPAPANAITIVTASGGTHTLNGNYASACYNGDSGGSQKDVLDVDGSGWVNSTTEYTSTDCSGTGTTVSAITATMSSGGTMAIGGWIDGGGGNTAPVAEDGSALSDTVTKLTILVTVVSGNATNYGIPLNTPLTIFYIVDDTGSGLILYRDDDGDLASTADPYLQ